MLRRTSAPSDEAACAARLLCRRAFCPLLPWSQVRAFRWRLVPGCQVVAHSGSLARFSRMSLISIARTSASVAVSDSHRICFRAVRSSRWSADELPADPNALVFPRQRGGLLPIEEYRRAFDKACKEVGIEGLVPHGLRHTTASLAISEGANVKVVQRMLGHATPAMTLDLYGHLLDDDLVAVADALGKAMERTAVSLRHPADNAGKSELLETAV